MPEFTPYPVELITPEGIAFSGDAERLVVPGAAGELGILANHAPLISLLEPGETRLTDADGTVRRYATDDGYVQVRKNHALVLVGEAVPAESIDAAEAGSRLDEAQAALDRATGRRRRRVRRAARGRLRRGARQDRSKPDSRAARLGFADRMAYPVHFDVRAPGALLAPVDVLPLHPGDPAPSSCCSSTRSRRSWLS